MKLTRLIHLGAAALCLGAAGAAAAQNAYPTRPITLVVPFAVGGNTDVVARIVAQKLTDTLGQTIVVENKTGAGAVIGTDAVAKAKPDGYTLLFGTSAYPISAALYDKLPYDPATALTPVSLVAEVPMVLAVNPKVTAASARVFIDDIKRKPGQYNYGSAGNGSALHMAVELLKYQEKLDLVHVPYRGAGPAMQGVVAGDVEFFIDAVSTSAPLVQNGRLRGLAVSTAKRSSVLPDVPTMKEQGYPAYETSIWNMVYAPTGTPQAILERLSTALQDVVKDAAVRERFAGLGVEPVEGSDLAHAARYLAAETQRWADVIRAGNIRVE